MIRKLIVDELISIGELPNLEELASRLGVSVERLLAILREEPPIKILTGLSSAQANRLLNHYEGFEMFSSEIRRTLTSFNETREKIRKIEKSSKE